MPEDLKKDYKTIIDDHLPSSILMSFYFSEGHQNLFFEKKTWAVNGVEKGLRYGENPRQEAALYKLMNGNLVFGDVTTIQPGRYLASDVELLQSGKHPGKINITDADNALNILRYFTNHPTVAIMKHNNPCGVAIGKNLLDAYTKANLADRLAAFGGTIALNRPVDKATAEAVVGNYSEVIVAPEYEEGVLDVFAKKKNLRVMVIENMNRLKRWVGVPVLDFKSLIDGGLILQSSYIPKDRTLKDIKKLNLGGTKYKGETYKINRKPTEQEYKDMLFGWLVESGITSNSVIYVKDGVTVGIGTGEQDRVGVAKIARDKAYEKLKDRICFEEHGCPYNSLLDAEREDDAKSINILLDIDDKVEEVHGGLERAVMVSDAFFPFRDGVDVGLREGVTAVIQPGGSERDFESIKACNEANATMVFTGQRSFKH